MLNKLITSVAFGSLLILSPLTFPLKASADIIGNGYKVVPPEGTISFFFTEKGRGIIDVPYQVQKRFPDKAGSPFGPPIIANGTYTDTNNSGIPLTYEFLTPLGATDFTPIVKDRNGKTIASLQGANNRRDGVDVWSFFLLDELPNTPWRIPVLASIPPIYTQVNLDIYLSNNPNGFLDGNWSIGQTLNDLGLTIINGQIPDIKGIYFATTEFTFDPLSEFGWVPIGGNSTYLNSADFQANNGNIEIIAENQSVSVSENGSTFSLLAFGTLGAASTLKRKLKPSKLSEKETTKVS